MDVIQIIALITASNGKDNTFYGMNPEIALIWVELASTIAIVAIVVVLVWETILHKKDLAVDKYAELRQHRHDLITLQIDDGNMVTLDVFREIKMPENYRSYEENDDEIPLTNDELRIFQFYVAEFDLYERVWSLKNEGDDVSEYEWLCWFVYLEKMSHHWLFTYAYNQTRTIFDAEFMAYVKTNLIDKLAETKTNFIDVIAKENVKEKLNKI